MIMIWCKNVKLHTDHRDFCYENNVMIGVPCPYINNEYIYEQLLEGVCRVARGDIITDEHNLSIWWPDWDPKLHFGDLLALFHFWVAQSSAWFPPIGMDNSITQVIS